MPRSPLVSLGLPVYNGAQFLRRALDSLIAQDFEDFEIIICDNGSEDRTAEICAEYVIQDNRVSYHQNNRNLGLVRNFNRTFDLSRGAYFKWVTHDDWHAAGSLQASVRLLEQNPQASLCATGVSLVDEHGMQFDTWIPCVDLRTPPAYKRLSRLLWTLGEPHPLFGMMRADTLRRTRLMQTYLGSDRTLLSHLALLGPIVHTEQVLHFYTVSATARANYRPSIAYDSANRGRLPLRTWRLIYEHLRLVEQSDLSASEKVFLIGVVLARFGLRDFRRLAAETYHSGRILAARAGRGNRLLPSGQ